MTYSKEFLFNSLPNRKALQTAIFRHDGSESGQTSGLEVTITLYVVPKQPFPSRATLVNLSLLSSKH